MVFVLDAILDFVTFAVVCVSRGPNVDLTVKKAEDKQEFMHSGKKANFRKNVSESRKTNLLVLHTLSKALLHVVVVVFLAGLRYGSSSCDVLFAWDIF